MSASGSLGKRSRALGLARCVLVLLLRLRDTVIKSNLGEENVDWTDSGRS